MDKPYRHDSEKPSAGRWICGADIGGAGDTVVAIETDYSQMYAFEETIAAYKGALIGESVNRPDAQLIVEMHEALRAYGASLLTRDDDAGLGKPLGDHLVASERVKLLAIRIVENDVALKVAP